MDFFTLVIYKSTNTAQTTTRLYYSRRAFSYRIATCLERLLPLIPGLTSASGVAPRCSVIQLGVGIIVVD